MQLAVSGLRVRFGPLTALDGVDLTVRAGELVALAGENGAGKSTLIRSIAGDITPTSGVIALDGRPVPADPQGAKRQGISVVWQDLALCDNLDIASNVMLGRERRRQLMSGLQMRSDVAAILEQLGVPLHDPERSVRSLSGGQRQLVAVARAMAHQPRLLLLDEPTAALGVQESVLVEELIARVRAQGTTILLACHDISQMFRLADRIAVLRHGRLIAEVAPSEVHPGDVVALLSGQEVDASARRQLTRLHGLTDRLVSADPSSSLALILSALGAALGSERLCIHLLADSRLVCAASLGLAPPLLSAWSELPLGPAGGPVGLAATAQCPIVEEDVQVGAAWTDFAELARSAKVASSWSVGNSNRGTLFLAVRGLPWVVLVVLGILVVYTTLLGRTRFGRYIYAIGGNAEAARRAGVNTNRIKVAAFALCGLTAGITGIIYSSYLGSISSGVNGGANVLNAVAAAVIGGTSLFGGRGKMLDAVLGGLVVGVIANGLQLLGLTAPAQLMWTALVLVGAVTVDALTRRGRSTV